MSTDGVVVRRFKREYNLRSPAKKLVENVMVDNDLWAAIGESLGKDRLKEEISTLKNQDVIKLL